MCIVVHSRPSSACQEYAGLLDGQTMGRPGLACQEHALTWLMFALALVRDILRPAPCELELHDCAFPLPLVTKLPVPARTPLSTVSRCNT